jgi:thiamine-phosphate pyrophosphorylase
MCQGSFTTHYFLLKTQKMISRLHYITQALPGYSHAQLAAQACAGGVTWVQLRLKHASPAEWHQQALATQSVCRQYGARFILNDNVDLAREIDADGVHLGKTDMPPAQARQLLGPEKIIGGTANTLADIEALAAAGVDYIGLGPFRFTATKENLSPVLGLAGYQDMLAQCRHLQLPIIAIGGLTAAEVLPLTQAGVYGLAVSTAISKSADPLGAARELVDLLPPAPPYPTYKLN